MTDTIYAPASRIVALDAGQIFTITLPAASSGRVRRVADTPGGSTSGNTFLSLASGSSVVLGPFVGATQHQLECSAGSISYTVAVPNRPYSLLLGKVEGFSGNKTLSADMNGFLLRCDDSSNVTVTVLNNLQEGFNVGLLMFGAGTITVAAASGATNRSSTSALSTQYNVGSLIVARNTGGSAAEFVLGGSFA